MVVYLFKCEIVESPLREMSDEEELLNFHFRVLPLWTMDGREMVREHAMSMYTLLPAMKNVNAEVLLKAFNEMVEYYKDDETKLGRRVLWLKLFLRRATMISPEDKKKVEERIDAFDQLLEEDEFVQHQHALGKEEGLAEGEARGIEKGEFRATQHILVNVTRRRFPSLPELARKKAERTQQIAVLDELINLIVDAPDEALARYILSSPPAA